MKPCRKCGNIKPLSEFHIARENKDGHRNECKDCWKKICKARYAQNRDEYIARTQKWREDNPEKYEEWRRRNREENRERIAAVNRRAYLQRKYGLSPDDFEFLVVAQGGKCRICEAAEGEKLHVDHHHDSGLVRGLLCGKCNKAIGLLDEDPQLFEAATSYLREKQLPLSCGDRARKRSRVRRPSTPSRPGDR